jgi:cobalt-zinc-cadmium efflux system outer membrane protein
MPLGGQGRPAVFNNNPFLAASWAVLAMATLAFGQPPSTENPEDIPAPGESMSLGLADLEQIALERNPTLVQAGAQVRMSRGKALQAGLLPNPTVGYVADQMGASGTAGEFHGMFFEQSIVTGGKLQLSRAKYIQEARQAELQVLAQRYRILSSVRLAYYDVLVRDRRLQLRRQLAENSEEAAKTVAELVNVGQANQSDLLEATLHAQRASANLRRAEGRRDGAWEVLTSILGMPELARTELADQLDLHGTEPIDRDTALMNLLSCSPELRFAQAEVARDQIALRRERVEPIPNVNIRAESGYNFESNDAVAGVEVGLRLPIFDKNQGTILQAQAEVARAQADVGRVELVLRRRFAESFADYAAALTLAENYRQTTLPKAREMYELYRESFEQRRAAWPQVLDAQRQYLELSEEYLDTVLEVRQAETRINTFFLEDGLSQPDEPSPQGHRDATARPR